MRYSEMGHWIVQAAGDQPLRIDEKQLRPAVRMGDGPSSLRPRESGHRRFDDAGVRGFLPSVLAGHRSVDLQEGPPLSTKVISIHSPLLISCLSVLPWSVLGDVAMRVGYFLSSEEFGPLELVVQARKAEEAGFQGLWISDHYHPWNHEQGNSPFVWSTIGALSQVTSLAVTTAVTCPTIRIHPAVIAQAAATSQVLLDGRFRLGVGSGEALNEHILGDAWPAADVRQEMLEEAVEVIRKLFAGGVVTHRGRHYTVEHAELYTRHPTPPPIYVSGFGSRSVNLAARIGDGYCLVMPEPGMVRQFREAGGGNKPVQAGLKVCYGDDAVARRHRAPALEQRGDCPASWPRCSPCLNTSSRRRAW